MNSIEIHNYLSYFKSFKGVYPKDLLPNTLQPNTGIVINTDNSNEPGEHWVAIYKSLDGTTIYFDSFGLPPLYEEIIYFLDKANPIGWYINTVNFQSTYQDTCGNYCMYFLTCMLRHGDFDIFRAIFNSRPEYNDIFAKLVYKVQT